jgi:hypothetical protein
MREFPSISDYNKAVENKYYPDQYNKFTPLLKETGELHFEPGGRAVVYKVEDPANNIKAIKLFTVNRDSLFQRYNQISKFIRNFSSSKYFVEFKFNERLIYCSDINSDKNDNIFPGLIMEWAEGKTLGNKVKNLCEQNDKTSLRKITEKFKEISLFIIDSEFGHGDLKHDNIIVDSDFNLKLIDYDGMFIPEFKGQKSGELGTPSFQHLKRTSDDFNNRIDDFSILSIYTSLLTLAKYPYLYEKYEDQQNLLFRLEDFENPEQSEIFYFLDKDAELAKWSYLLKKSLSNDHIYIPELKNYINGIFPKPSISVIHNPEKIIAGCEIELSWTTENVDEVLFINQKVDLNSSVKVLVYPNYRFLFKLKNHFETIEYEYNLEVLPVLKIKEFRSKQQKIEHGKETQLVWDIENAEKVELHWLGNMEVVPLKGEKTISLKEHSNFKVIVTALDGATIEEKEITVQVFKRVEVKSFVSDLEFVVESLPVKLSWEIDNASSVTLSSNMQADIDVTGINEIEILPRKTSVFYLKAKNELFSANSSQLKIEVQNIPTFNPSIIPKLPSGKDLIPSFELDFKELSETILNESQIGFQSAMKPTKRFNILNSLQKILK